MVENTSSTPFQHPLARAEILRPEGLLDRISLRDHIVSVEIGAFEVERAVTQRLSFNVVVEVSDVDGPIDDDVDKILSYDRVTDAISQALAAQRVNLLETLAEDIAARILAAPQAVRVFLRIEKLDRGIGDLGVEIVRDAQSRDAQHSDWNGARPLLVCLTPEVDLSLWLPVFQDHAHPVLLLPEHPEVPALTGEAVADQRLLLLAWDTAAWRGAACHADLNVVGSRTEMEWGFGRGQVNFWAPMKQILDSTTPPTTFDAAAIGRWAAEQHGVRCVAIACDVVGAQRLDDPAAFLALT